MNTKIISVGNIAFIFTTTQFCICILSFMNNEALHCLEAMKITNFEENLHQ
jgi:hypothetical protein